MAGVFATATGPLRVARPAAGGAVIAWALLACSAPRAPVAELGSPPVAVAGPVTELEALGAFAELYGLVRWYHPSDRAAGARWHALAVSGVRAVRGARDREALRRALQAWVEPIGSGVVVGLEGEPLPEPLPWPGGPAVAWQHLGYGDSAVDHGGLYRSVRLGRPPGPTGTSSSAEVVAGSPARAVAGQRVKVTARVKVQSDGTGDARFWMVSDRGPPYDPLTTVGEDGPALVDPTWTEVERVHTLEADTRWVHWGFTVTGRTRLWADDVRWWVLEPDGAWRELPSREPSFDLGGAWWTLEGFGYDLAVVEEHGDPVLSVAHQDLVAPRLFEAEPAPGERVTRSLPGGVTVSVPLTVPVEAPEGPAADQEPVPADADDPDVRVAAALVAWNVLRHFHPWGAPAPWDTLRDRTLSEAMAAGSREAVVDTLWTLMRSVPDGHAWVGHPQVTGGLCGLPLRWLRVGDDLVVTNALDGPAAIGDRVLEVDGEPVDRALERAGERVSGSDHFRRAFAAERLAMGACGEPVALRVERAGVPEDLALSHTRAPLPLFPHPPVEVLDDGVVLVDLNQASFEDLRPDLEVLAGAEALVFDLREYPAGGSTELLARLLRGPDPLESWMRVPRRIRPDEVAGFTPHQWSLQPLEPRIEAPVVFLSSPLALSAAESVLAFAQDAELAEVVGAASGGANGNVAQAALPGGYGVQFTGMLVVRGDGSPLHGVGVRPDVPAEPTLDGLVAGRDEVRERAVALVRERMGAR